MNFWNCNLILAFWHVPCIYPVQKNLSILAFSGEQQMDREARAETG